MLSRYQGCARRTCANVERRNARQHKLADGNRHRVLVCAAPHRASGRAQIKLGLRSLHIHAALRCKFRRSFRAPTCLTSDRCDQGHLSRNQKAQYQWPDNTPLRLQGDSPQVKQCRSRQPQGSRTALALLSAQQWTPSEKASLSGSGRRRAFRRGMLWMQQVRHLSRRTKEIVRLD